MQGSSRHDDLYGRAKFCVRAVRSYSLRSASCWRTDVKFGLAAAALDILIVLLARAGEAVSKNELMSVAWPNMHVEEANLRVHIGALRKAMGDQRQPRAFHRKCTRTGYCFVATGKYQQDRNRGASALEGCLRARHTGSYVGHSAANE